MQYCIAQVAILLSSIALVTEGFELMLEIRAL